MKLFRRSSLRCWLVPVLLVAFGWVFLPGSGFHEAQAAARQTRPVIGPPARRSLTPAEMKAILGAGAGAPEHWQASTPMSPFTVVKGDGNALTALPIVAWKGRGGTGINFVLYHNSDACPVGMPPPGMVPPPAPLGYGWRHSYMCSISEDIVTGDATVTEPDGRKHVFTKNADNSYTRPAGCYDRLTKTSGLFTVTRPDQVKWNFNLSNNLSSIVDLNSNTITVAYGTNSQVSTVTDASGRVLTLTYSTGNLITTVQDPLSRTWTLQWTGSPARLYRVVEPSTAAYYVEFTANSFLRLTAVKDKRGYSWSYGYDGSSTPKLNSCTTPLTYTRSIDYSVSFKVTDEGGKQTTYFPGGSSATTAITEVPGGLNLVTNLTRDGDYNVTSLQKPSGQRWDTTFDSSGNILTEEDPITRLDPNVTKWTYTYNSLNRRTSATDALGNLRQWFFDSNGNCTQERDPLLKDTFYTVNASGDRTQMTDAKGKIWRWTRNSNGDVTESKDPLLNTTTTEVNTLGWATLVTGPTGIKTRNVYDDLGRLKKVIHVNADGSDGPYVENTLDANGNITQVRDENANTVSMVVNALGWTSSFTDARGYTTSFGFNNVGIRTSLTNARSKTTTWDLDAAYRVTKVTYPDLTTEEFTWTSNGLIASRKDGRGYVIYHSYDNADRLTGVDYPTGTDTSLTYRANDELASQVDGTGTYSWSNDARGAVTEAVSPQGTLDFLYDDCGRRTTTTRPSLGSEVVVFDDAGRASSLTNRFSEQTSFTLNAAGGITQQVQSNGTKVLTTFDSERGWVNRIEHRKSDNTLLAQYDYTRDSCGNITRIVALNDYQVDYTLDACYQLTREVRTGNVPYDISYVYDSVGNRTSKSVVGGSTESYTYGDNNQCVTAGSKSFTYDNNGNLASKTVSSQTTSYSWGYENELTGITYPNSSTNSFTTNRLFNRVQKTDSAGASTSLYDGKTVVADSRADYTWGGATGLISERAGTASRWYHGDTTGGARGLTDSTQAATDSLDFDAFGLAVRTTGASITPFRHKGGQGYRTDADSGLMLLGQRYYDRSLGRFISRDPLGYNAGDVNLYRYALNNPVSAGDPSGQNPIAAAIIGIGLAALITEFLVVLTTAIIAGLVIVLIGLIIWKVVSPMFQPRSAPPPTPRMQAPPQTATEPQGEPEGGREEFQPPASPPDSGQIHHIATDKHGYWTPIFQGIFANHGMTLQDPANLVVLPGHYGPHPEAYHQWVYGQIKDTDDLRGELDKIRAWLTAHPQLLNTGPYPRL